MAHVSLYRKYRPNAFSELVGQDHVTTTLARAIDSQSWHHAYLFTGPRGTGKTSSARLLAMALNASTGPTSTPDPDDPIVVSIREGSCPDVIEIDAASNSGVDDVRDLRENINYSPTQGRLRIYIVDECHMLSNSAWNAFLKTIEEPPGHVVFIFATTEPHKVLPTVLSRTQRFDFRRVSDQVLADHCRSICAKEGISISDEALAIIVRAGDGSVRDTLSVLDQVVAFTGAEIDLDAVNRVLGVVPTALLDQLVLSIANSSVADAFTVIGSAADQGIDLRQFAFDAQNYLRELLILSAAPHAGLIQATEERLHQLRELAQCAPTTRLLYAVEVLNDAQVRMRAGNTRLPLELAVAKAVLFQGTPAPQGRTATASPPPAAQVTPAPGNPSSVPSTPTNPPVETPAPQGKAPAAPTPAPTASSQVSPPNQVSQPSQRAQPRQSAQPSQAEPPMHDTRPAQGTQPSQAEPPNQVGVEGRALAPSQAPRETGTAPRPSDRGIQPTQDPPVSARKGMSLVAEGDVSPPARNQAPEGLTLKEVQRRWDECLNVMERSSRKLSSILMLGTPVAVSGNTISIGYSESIFIEEITRAEDQRLIVEVFSAVFGQVVQVKGVHTDETHGMDALEVSEEELSGPDEPVQPEEAERLFHQAVTIVKDELGAKPVQ